MPIWSIMVFPALFTAGMSLVDTADSVLMVGAYGWAFTKPMRKLYYNLTITFASVLVALLVGGIEALGLDRAARRDCTAASGTRSTRLNDNFGASGLSDRRRVRRRVGRSALVYRAKGYDSLELARAQPQCHPERRRGMPVRPSTDDGGRRRSSRRRSCRGDVRRVPAVRKHAGDAGVQRPHQPGQSPARAASTPKSPASIAIPQSASPATRRHRWRPASQGRFPRKSQGPITD